MRPSPTPTVTLPPTPEAPVPQARPGLSPWDVASILALLGLAGVALLTFADYGTTWDEPRQQRYGELLLDYYRTLGADRSSLHYFDLFRYGPAFDLLVALLQQVSPLPTYAVRHLITAAVGLLGLGGTWLLARTLAGPRAGFLALVLLSAAPDWYGHMYFNPKDVPFATAMVWALYALVRLLGGLPRLRLGALLGFGLAAGLAMAIRVGGGVVFAYAGLLLVAWTVIAVRRRTPPPIAFTAGGLGALGLVGAGTLAAGLTLALWPWAQQDPVDNVLTALRTFSDFPFDTRFVYAGEVVSSADLPWHYLPVMLLVRLPEPVLVGLALVPLFALRSERSAGNSAIVWAAVALAALVPVADFLLVRPTLYDGIRHLIFILPPLVVIAAGALDRAWSGLPGRLWEVAMALVLLGWLGAQVQALVRVHPYQYILYNGLAGGVPGANGRFELDYWGASVKEATEGLVRELVARHGEGIARQPLRVAVCGPTDSVRPYLPEAWQAADARDAGQGADLFVAVPKIPCEVALQGETLVRAEREGALLSSAGQVRGGSVGPK